MKKLLATALLGCTFLTACEKDPRAIKIGDQKEMSQNQAEL